MGLMNEYIDRKLSVPDLEFELLKLIAEYNSLRDTYLFVYAASTSKQIPSVALEQKDFYCFSDLLSDQKERSKVDVYLETPGGSGETAEEIGRFLHNNFETVSFVVSGEAKSAGTILALSGDEILMTETGSLGPIDAQVKIGRSVVSAYDYMDWIQEKRKEAEKQGALNPLDATIIAQISPGELDGVFHSLKFAEDLVKRWLVLYKFKKWKITRTRKIPVTDAMKRERAETIARELTDHSKWRSHGRSIKTDDLESIGLDVTRVDDYPQLSNVVYRIQTVCRLLFEMTTVFKIFATQDNKLMRHAIQAGDQKKVPQSKVSDVVEIETECPKCGKTYKLYAKLADNPKIDKDFQAKGFIPFPKDAKIICSCEFEIDLSPIKNQIEIQASRNIVTKIEKGENDENKKER